MNSLVWLESRFNRLVWLFIILNLLDCILTSIILANGGLETNPWLASTNHWWKMLPVFGIGIIIAERKWILKACNIGMGLICLWNLIVVLYILI